METLEPAKNQMISDKNNRTAIILAGGEGSRASELTRRADGVHLPKQFCALAGDMPLLDQSRRRVSFSVAPERTSFVLYRDHERFFAPDSRRRVPQEPYRSASKSRNSSGDSVFTVAAGTIGSANLGACRQTICDKVLR